MTEVLSPAGNIDTAVVAIRAGADAVYFGAPGFNARRNAKNFTTGDMFEFARLARINGVKTYLTLNTLVSDSEREEALITAETAAKAGIDALIVQDIGLARLLRLRLPSMPLHASTQMSVHSAKALPVLKELGFCRVVPAREMDMKSLSELCRTAERLGMEVEVFVHGALCMCLSGQCYLSSMLGGRSGNRGLCAQPCRLAFSADDGTGHDLSLKDMSYVNHISELANMGVASFKIEGRMKRTEYVAAATAACRAAADGKGIPEDAARVLSGIFSRSGHTDGYLSGNLGRGMFGVRTDSDEQQTGELLTATHELYRRERQSVPLSATIRVKNNEPVGLTICDRDGNIAAVSGKVPEKARSIAADKAYLAEKTGKCGGTCYYIDSFTADVDDGLAVGASELKDLRRSALEIITEKRSEYDGSRAVTADISGKMTVPSRTSEMPKTVTRFRSPRQIPESLNGISAVVLPVECDFSAVSLPERVDVFAEMPRGMMHGEGKIAEKLKAAMQNGIKTAVCGNLASIQIAKEVGIGFVAGFGMNIYNSDSVTAAKNLGAEAAVLSFELSISDAVKLGGNIPRGIISYGRLPLMLVRNCPGKNGKGCAECGGKCFLTDRKGIEFPVMCRGEFSEIFNSRVLWMLDRKEEMRGLKFNVLYFTDETKEQCSEVIKAAALGGAPKGEFTRGLYYREVL